MPVVCVIFGNCKCFRHCKKYIVPVLYCFHIITHFSINTYKIQLQYSLFMSEKSVSGMKNTANVP